MPRPVTDEDLGLNIIYPPETGTNPGSFELEIIAVHGLGAHPNNTWTKVRDEKGTQRHINWLSEKDMLPASIPNARIWQFGYHSQWFGENSLRTTAENVAKMLINEIKTRLLDKDIPIVFISHSFGGLVVLKTISLAFYKRHLCEELFQRIGGLVFFGTPFRGAKGLAIDDMILAALSVFKPEDIEPQVLEILQTGSETLLELVDEFCSVWSPSESNPITCFYELQPSEVGKLVGKERRRVFVVEQGAGYLDSFRGVNKIALQKNHFNINRFASPTEVEFRHTRDEIAKIAQTVTRNTQKEPFSSQDVVENQSHSALPSITTVAVTKDNNTSPKGPTENRSSSLVDQTSDAEDSKHNTVSLVYPHPFTSDQIVLGRLVRNIEEPDTDFFDTERTLPKSRIGISSYVDYEDVQSAPTASLPVTLSRLCSESRTRKLAALTKVTTKHVTAHRLKNARSWFKLIIKDKSTRDWVEESSLQGDDIYFVVGFHIMKDATFTEYVTDQQMTGDEQTYETLEGSLRIQHRFVKEGEHVCAIKYQSVRYRLHSSEDLDPAWLAKENFWRHYWTLRGSEKEEDDVTEAYLEDGIKLLDKYELYTDGDDHFQY